MKKLALIVLASFLVSGSGYAQISSFPWTEGFESGTIPSGWTQEYVPGMEYWSVEDYFPHNGNYSAFFIGYHKITKLITPKLDLSGMTNPILKFWHIEPAYDDGWDIEQDTLKVYYKNSLHGVWNLLGVYSSGVFAYTEDVILLPNVSNDYYIAFEGVGAYGIGMVLDDIIVMDFANYDDVEVVSILTPLAAGINLTNSEQVKVLIKNNGSDPITNFSLDLELDGTLIATEIYAGTIASLSQAEYTFTATLDLSAAGSYTVKATATVANDQDNTNDFITKTVSNKICSLVSTFPYTEDFESEMLGCWSSYDIDGSGEQWAINVDYWYDEYIRGIASAGHRYDCDYSNTEGWLVSPQLAIPSSGNYILEFWSINGDPEDYEYNGIWVSTTGANPTSSTFTQLKQLSGTEVSRDWKKIIVSLNAYAGQNIYIGFKYAGDCADLWFIDDIKIYDFSNYDDVEVVSILTPLAAGRNLSSSEQVKVLIKNNGSDPITNFSLDLELDGTLIATETYAGTIASLSQEEYTFTATLDLSAAGNYTVKVTATVANDQDNTNDSKTETISNTICNSITVFPWEADLIYYIPSCWTNIDADGDGYNWESFSYGGAMSVASYSTPDNWLITPPLALNSNNYSLFFEAATPYAEYYPITEKYSVLVSTTGTNPSDFTAIHTDQFSIIGDSKAVELSLSAYKGQTIYIAFRHWGGFVLELSNIVVDAHVGVASYTQENDVQVYPNPSNGVVNVSVTENSTVKVLDVLGRVLDVYTVNGNSVLNFTQAAGFYFIQVESNGKTSTHKVVITKN